MDPLVPHLGGSKTDGFDLPDLVESSTGKDEVAKKTEQVADGVLGANGKGAKGSKVVQPKKGMSGSVDQTQGESSVGIAPKALESVAQSSGSQASSKPVVSVHSKWLSALRDDISAMDPQEIYERIGKRRDEIRETKEKYRNYESSPDLKIMEKEVRLLMSTGNIKLVSGGKSGVYFLCSADGLPKFVIKPIDEEALTLNNPKGDALPYADNDGVGRTKVGIPLYQSAQNSALGYEIAKELGVERATPRCTVMILESSQFADLTDDVTEDLENLLKFGGMPDREKLCSVQEFIPGCEEIGTVILSQARLTEQELMALEDDKYEKITNEHTPDNIDHAIFEEVAILTWVIGEKDGNAGNIMVSKEIDKNSGLRNAYKIDCAASSPEDNVNLITGLGWAMHNCAEKLSDKAKDIIKNIDEDKIASLMRKHGKGDSAIEAMKKRVELLKDISNFYPDIEISSFDDFYQTHTY